MFDKLLEAIVGVLHWFQFWAICGAEYQGVVTRFGHPVRDLKPGFNWRWPCIESAVLADIRVWADVLPAQSLRTKDGVDMVLRLMVSHQAGDVRLFLFKTYDARNQLLDLAAGQLGDVLIDSTAAEVYNGVALKKVRRKIVARAAKWGIIITGVAFADAAAAASFRLFGVHSEPA